MSRHFYTVYWHSRRCLKQKTETVTELKKENQRLEEDNQAMADRLKEVANKFDDTDGRWKRNNLSGLEYI